MLSRKIFPLYVKELFYFIIFFLRENMLKSFVVQLAPFDIFNRDVYGSN